MNGLRIETTQSKSNHNTVRSIISTTPFYIVYHGTNSFSHEHFGIHLGQEDHLTFIGESDQVFWGHFLDCRKNSSTFGERLTLQLSPSIAKTLVIPAGVGHAFQGIENVFTLNNYLLYLPDKKTLCSGEYDWNIGNDVLNVPLDCDSDQIPRCSPNTEVASNLLYCVLQEFHQDYLKKTSESYPIIQDVETSDQGIVRLRFRVPSIGFQSVSECRWQKVAEKDGLLEWRPHLIVRNGKDSGIYVIAEFSETQLLRTPCKSLRAASGFNAKHAMRVTFFSPGPESMINLSVSDLQQAQKLNCPIPSTGEYEAIVPAGIDISILEPSTYVLARRLLQARI